MGVGFSEAKIVADNIELRETAQELLEVLGTGVADLLDRFPGCKEIRIQDDPHQEGVGGTRVVMIPNREVIIVVSDEGIQVEMNGKNIDMATNTIAQKMEVRMVGRRVDVGSGDVDGRSQVVFSGGEMRVNDNIFSDESTGGRGAAATVEFQVGEGKVGFVEARTRPVDWGSAEVLQGFPGDIRRLFDQVEDLGGGEAGEFTNDGFKLTVFEEVQPGTGLMAESQATMRRPPVRKDFSDN